MNRGARSFAYSSLSISQRLALIVVCALAAVASAFVVYSLDYFLGVSPFFALALPAGIGVIALSFRWPIVPFALFWGLGFALGPAQGVGVQIGSITPNISDVLLVLGLASVVFRYRLRPFPRVVTARFLAGIALGVLALGVGLTQNPLEEVFTDLRMLIYLVLFVWWFHALMRTESPATLARAAVLTLCVGAAVAVVRASLINSGYLPAPIDEQVQVTYYQELGANRLTLPGADTLSVMFLPVFWAALLRTSSRMERGLLLVGAASATGVTIMTFTRTDWIAVTAGVLLVSAIFAVTGWSRLARRRLVILTIALLVVAYAASFVVLPGSDLPLRELATRRFSMDSSVGGPNNLDYRWQEGKAALQRVAETPVWGAGLGGQFLFAAFPTFVEVPVSWTHSGWIWLILKGGGAGLLAVLALFVIAANRLVAVARHAGQEDRAVDYAIGMLGGLCALAVMCLTNNRFSSLESWAFLALCLTYGESALRDTVAANRESNRG